MIPTPIVDTRHVACSRWSRRTVLIAAAAAVAGCSPPPPLISPEQHEPDSPQQLFAQALSRRAHAVATGDLAGFVADLDPGNAELRRGQEMLFSNLRQLPLRTFAEIPRSDALVPANGIYHSPVTRIVQLSTDDVGNGVMPAEIYRYTIALRGNRIVITSIVGKTAANAHELGIDGPNADAPWNFTPLSIRQVGANVLAADSSVGDLDRYVSVCHTQAERIDALWGQRLRYPGTVLFLTRDPATFGRWYSFEKASNFDAGIEGFAPRQWGARVDGTPFDGQYAGSRVVAHLGNIARFGDDPGRVIRHELYHGVTSRAAVTANPLSAGPARWVVEGGAAWSETLDNPAQANRWRASANQGFTGHLPSSAGFYGANVIGNYAQGSCAFLTAQQLKGPQGAVEFYAQLIEHPDLDGLPLADMPAFDTICRTVLGVTARSFTTTWAQLVTGGRA